MGMKCGGMKCKGMKCNAGAAGCLPCDPSAWRREVRGGGGRGYLLKQRRQFFI